MTAWRRLFPKKPQDAAAADRAAPAVGDAAGTAESAAPAGETVFSTAAPTDHGAPVPQSMSRHGFGAFRRPDSLPEFLTGERQVFTPKAAPARHPAPGQGATSDLPPAEVETRRLPRRRQGIGFGPDAQAPIPRDTASTQRMAAPPKAGRAGQITLRVAPVAALALGAALTVGYSQMDGGLMGYGDLLGRKPIFGQENAVNGAFVVRIAKGPSYLLEDLALKSVWKPRAFRKTGTVGPVGSFEDLLAGKGVPPQEATAAAAALKPVYDPGKMHVGQKFAINFFPETGGGDRFTGVRIDTGADASILVERGGDGRFSARRVDHPVIVDLVHNEATIDNSLYIAGLHQGVPPAVMIDLIHLLSFDVDFQRDIRRGDTFEAMYERVYDERTGFTRPGDLLYIGLTLAGQKVRYWRYRTKSGRVAYFDERGRGVKKSLMRTPIDGARLSSGFGMRRHPILGYSGMHQGVDFAAPSGTPIYAAGDGVIAVAGRKGGYGNYIRVRHHKNYSTAYAHMKGFARGMRPGKAVRQGQVIGYVGSTGRSTGPHLHYEVLVGKRQINPLTMRLPSGNQLKGKELAKFQIYRRKLEGQLVALEDGQAVVLTARRLGTTSVSTDGAR